MRDQNKRVFRAKIANRELLISQDSVPSFGSMACNVMYCLRESPVGGGMVV